MLTQRRKGAERYIDLPFPCASAPWHEIDCSLGCLPRRMSAWNLYVILSLEQ
jgi:hypothetical protein